MDDQKPIRLFYAAEDYFPAWRVDLVELFSRHLARQGLALTWSFQRKDKGACARVDFEGYPAYLPFGFGRENKIQKLLTLIAAWFCDFGLFVHWVFGPRYDILQARDRRYLAALLAWLAARLRGSKFTYWLSFPFPENHYAKAAMRRGAMRHVDRMRGYLSGVFVYRFLMRRADHVFVQSDQMLDDVAAYGVPRNKMTAVPMGVAPELPDQVMTKPEKSERGLVVYLGTLARVRRMEVLIEAFAIVAAQVSHARLAIVGAGPEPGEREELERLAETLGIRQRVEFTGFVPLETAWDWAARAAVCVSPFFPTPVLNSASPTKLIEYLAIGKAVVANDHPDQSRVLSDSGAGLCVHWSAQDFADAIIRLLSDEAGAAAMGARGPAWVKANRTYDVLASQVMARYRALISGRR